MWEKGPLEADPWMQVSLVEWEASVADIKAKVWLEAEAVGTNTTRMSPIYCLCHPPCRAAMQAMKLFVEERRKEKTTQQREQLKRSSTITRASEASSPTAGRGRADDRKRHKGETAPGDTEGWSIQRFEQMVRSAQADMELTQMESNIKKAARSASVYAAHTHKRNGQQTPAGLCLCASLQCGSFSGRASCAEEPTNADIQPTRSCVPKEHPVIDRPERTQCPSATHLFPLPSPCPTNTAK